MRLVRVIPLPPPQHVGVGPSKITVGLGWSPNTQTSKHEHDLDLGALMLGKDGKLISAGHFVYYQNVESPDGAVKSLGDSLVGEGEGGNETILVNLDAVNRHVTEIIFAAILYQADAGRSFGQIRNACIRISTAGKGKEICKCELSEDFSTETSLEFGRLYARAGAWTLDPTGRGLKGGFQEWVDAYC